jgi:hypothetical protein
MNSDGAMVAVAIKAGDGSGLVGLMHPDALPTVSVEERLEHGFGPVAVEQSEKILFHDNMHWVFSDASASSGTSTQAKGP